MPGNPNSDVKDQGNDPGPIETGPWRDLVHVDPGPIDMDVITKRKRGPVADPMAGRDLHFDEISEKPGT